MLGKRKERGEKEVWKVREREGVGKEKGNGENDERERKEKRAGILDVVGSKRERERKNRARMLSSVLFILALSLSPILFLALLLFSLFLSLPC